MAPDLEELMRIYEYLLKSGGDPVRLRRLRERLLPILSQRIKVEYLRDIDDV